MLIKDIKSDETQPLEEDDPEKLRLIIKCLNEEIKELKEVIKSLRSTS